MSDTLERLAQALESGPEQLRERLRGKVSYGYCEYAPHVAARINADGSETYGRFDDKAGFVPFTEEEDADFKREFAWHFTKIFNKDNVIQFPVCKHSPT